MREIYFKERASERAGRQAGRGTSVIVGNKEGRRNKGTTVQPVVLLKRLRSGRFVEGVCQDCLTSFSGRDDLVYCFHELRGWRFVWFDMHGEAGGELTGPSELLFCRLQLVDWT